ncbi:hypothetical protein EIN_185020 [Entamoeba invadens IP1]|uniref:hypothetical protein n=1 Tax=Entamoeba invadens IP1 TaxID=370355 RepID=UPI0002C3F7E1|nr:hypothetical protein EIN_185020 [Entamoeba invadens IP1]ELP94125.1 hypothetical protein EIN_185020 [Entamoeba invadens IP1]|eukprot:XP_004260896.1 hypothetical protein EIN_185020 [Entamoeba invadens IP1]
MLFWKLKLSKSMRGSHNSGNIVKNDTACVCQWSPEEQLTLEEELYQIQQQNQDITDISSILKISSKFPSKSIQQITSRIKWLQMSQQIRPQWEVFCQNESFYIQKAKMMPQTTRFLSPRSGPKDVYLPSTIQATEPIRRRSYSMEEKTTLSPRQPSIMIGSNNSQNSPRVYHAPPPVTFTIPQTTNMDWAKKLIDDNEVILGELQSCANVPLCTSFIHNGNTILQLTNLAVHGVLPFFSKELLLFDEAKRAGAPPYIQSTIGFKYQQELPKTIAVRQQQSVSLPGSSLSPMSSQNGSLH